MRLLLSILFVANLVLLPTPILGQIGNEWIQFGQEYFKITTGEDRIYRITYDQLQAAGVPLSSILPSRFRIYHRGQEQSIFVSSQTDTPLQPGEFIDFYGTRNDGTLDADLYVDPGAQPHTEYNLYSDSTAYFLTWGQTGSGRRMEFSNLFNVDNLQPEAYHSNRSEELFTSDYSRGRVYPEGGINAETNLSQFDFGEGWTGPRILKGQVQDFVVSGSGSLAPSGSEPTLELVIAGRNNQPHNFEVLVGSTTSNLRTLGQHTFDFYNTIIIQESLSETDFAADGSLVVRLSVIGFDEVAADAISLSYLEIASPQPLDMGGADQKAFYLRQNPSGTSFVSIANPPADPALFDITDPGNPVRIGFDIGAPTIEAVIPNTSVERTLLVVNGSALSPELKSVNFNSIDPAQISYSIISHSSLMQPGGGVEEYVNYRSSEEGGGHAVLSVSAEQLYDQFNYGEISPRAIYNFSKFLWDGGNIEYIFLIGKSLSVDHDYYRKGSPSGTQLKDLVPTAGFPGSDILFTAGLGSTTFESAIPTGRIIAQSNQEVLAYLNKVREMESTPYDNLWRKNLLHLSGGLSINEVNRFLGYVNGYKTISEGDYLGGFVTTKSKEGNSNSELINVSDIVNQGVSLITFYGHSAPNLTDIEIGDVSDPSLGYSNKGRYCSILVNGCNAGNIFSTASSFGQDWILTPDLGAISYLAHSATGFEGALNRYSQIFYQVAFADSTQFSRIGDIQTELSTRFLDQFTNTERNISQVQQVVLQGDPASVLFGAEKPDYSITDDDLFLEGFANSKITASVDSFKVVLMVANLGRTDLDSLEVLINRTANKGEVNSMDTMYFESVKYLDTLYFTIYNETANGFGINRFDVQLDPQNKVAELSELNNSARIELVIPLGATENLAPIDYGVVENTTPTLLAQTFDQLSGSRTFAFELDTTNRFDSPFKMTANLEGTVLASWEVQLLEIDSMVYYWRTRFQNPLPEEDTAWATSSFIYIADSPTGWAQRHHGQIEQNSLDGLFVNPVSRNLEFNQTSSTMEVLTHGNGSPLSDPANSVLAVNGQNLIVGSPTNRLCRDDAIAAIAFDKSTTIAYAVLFNSGFDVLDPERCGITPQVINSLTNSAIEGSGDRLAAFLDLVPEGDFVLLFSIGEVTFQNWSPELINKLEGIGASAGSVSTLTNGEPWILFGRKGLLPGVAEEVRADPLSSEPITDQQIQLVSSLVGRNSEGSVTTPLIGPARAWTKFDQILSTTDQPLTDINRVGISGFSLDGVETILESSFNGASLDLSQIDASTYPLLQITLNTQDQLNLTPAGLEFWQVQFEGVPEGILLKSTPPEEPGKTLQEGAIGMAGFSFRNISDKPFSDSLQVEYTIFNQESRSSESGTLKIKAPAPTESSDFSIEINTLGKAGSNDLSVYVNPRVQVEQRYTNNVISIPDYVMVARDESNPLLDVTFDGRYIMDGEIVSPSPLILIKLVDDNQILLKTDTLGVDIMLKAPCETCEFEKINFTDPNVSWTPADDNSDFSVEYQPGDLGDGIYTLKVQAADQSGNSAGVNPYSIRFEVINESQVTNFYPYPNPFSTSTRFVFTLTGSEIPDEIKIQIMTISGIIVREITQDEIGPIQIGNNITEYAWNGKDEYGDQLANGVYLYRVFIRSQGQLIEKRETSADKAFKKGFGKLYLLR